MNSKDYEARIQELESQVKVLQEANVNLINRNMQLGQMVDAFYDVRRRIEMLKDLVIRHKELLKEADLRDDDELMAVIETKLETGQNYTNPDFGLKELAELIGTTQTRIVELFRRSSPQVTRRLSRLSAPAPFDVLSTDTALMEHRGLCPGSRLHRHPFLQPQVPGRHRHDAPRVPHTLREQQN